MTDVFVRPLNTRIFECWLSNCLKVFKEVGKSFFLCLLLNHVLASLYSLKLYHSDIKSIDVYSSKHQCGNDCDHCETNKIIAVEHASGKKGAWVLAEQLIIKEFFILEVKIEERSNFNVAGLQESFCPPLLPRGWMKPFKLLTFKRA